MLQRTAPTCLAIRVVTGIVLLAAAGLAAASFRVPALIPVGLLFDFIIFLCWLTAPRTFELRGRTLTVATRLGPREFGPVERCEPVASRPSFTLRLWGNGGLFAGTGLYWNRTWGVFRCYVTAGRYTDYLFITTPGRKLLISPEDPAAFAAACPAASP